MRKNRFPFRWLLGTLCVGAVTAVALAVESSDPAREALDQLAAEIEGAILYCGDDQVRKVVIGEWKPVDLGRGNYARWSPDGKKIAVWRRGRVWVMDADGSGRKQLVDDAAKEEDGSPIEFHTNGREIVYVKEDDGLWTVNIQNGATRKMDLPGEYTGEPCLSADGKRLAARRDNDLYAIDLVKKTHRQYARGCSPGVSPDGQRLMNNVGSHRQLAIRNWDGGGEFRIDTRTCRPDRQWDDHHWSNHTDYIMGQGEGRREEAYVLKISENRATRVSWEGGMNCSDLYVARAKKCCAGCSGG
jgi:Tol biopolymer transport system component